MVDEPRQPLLPDLTPLARREPMTNLPRAVVAVICLLVAVHLWRLVLSAEGDLGVLAEFAVVPARFALELGWLDQARIVQATVAGHAAPEAAERLAVARFFLDGGGARPWSLLTYGVIHSGTAHIVMNCLWLAVFGSPVARRFGCGRFLVLMIIGTAAGAVLHIVLHPTDVAPLVGASAAVSAATGAAARFVFSGSFKFGAVGDDSTVRAVPALSLMQLLRHRPSMIFIVLWFGTNWLFGSGVIAFADDGQSIAWEAHVGGFLAGLLLFPLLDRSPARA